MPIQSFATFTKWVARENISVPQHFYDALLPVKDDDAQVREVGTKLVGEMCRKILAAPEGISGLHIYTLNLQVGARMLLEEVGLEADIEKVSPLPWTPVSISLLLFGVGKSRIEDEAESACCMEEEGANDEADFLLCSLLVKTVPHAEPKNRIHSTYRSSSFTFLLNLHFTELRSFAPFLPTVLGQPSEVVPLEE